jgi:xanthine dehydrogenase YagT iron-sulfur-binding subunit
MPDLFISISIFRGEMFVCSQPHRRLKISPVREPAVNFTKIGRIESFIQSIAFDMNPQPSASPLPAPSEVAIQIVVNGQQHQLNLAPWITLLDLLREQLRLTGAKKGCDHGQCGACTVLMDGRRINSCLKLAVSVDGSAITTIEGLGTPTALHPLQQAFIERDAFQCGYCTPGQICSAKALIDEGSARTREEVREWMSGNLCRCGAYSNITDAILDVMDAPAKSAP